MQIAVVAAGFDPSEADQLRRSLATFRRMGTISTFKDRFINGMLARGYDEDFAQRCFAQIEGFGEYGFPESHAAAFAMLVYVSAWLKKHHPAVFACGFAELPAHGLLRPRADRARRARTPHRSAAHLREREHMGQHVRAAGRWRFGAAAWAFARSRAFAKADADWIVAARGNGYRDP